MPLAEPRVSEWRCRRYGRRLRSSREGWWFAWGDGETGCWRADRCGPGTRVTKESGDMGNTSRHTRGREALDAVAGDFAHGPTEAAHQGLSTRTAIGDGARRSFRDKPQNGLQVDRSPRAGRGERLGESQPAPSVVSARHSAGHRGRRARRAPASSPVGGEEAAPHSPAERSARDLAGPDHGVRPAQTPRPDPDAATPAAALAPGASPVTDDGTERDLDRRLQRAVQDARRRLLLSAHPRRWLQSVSARVPGAALHGGRLGPADLPARLRGVRLAAHHPLRQRRPIRHDGARPLVAALGVVDPARDLPGIDPTGPPRTERAARAHAPHIEGGGHAAAVRELARATGPLQSFSRGVQRRASARSAGSGNPRLPLSSLAAGAAADPRAAGISWSLRGPSR